MPAIPQLPPEQWEALKLANIRGLDDAELSAKFGVAQTAIRQKRCRDAAWSAAMSDARQKPVASNGQSHAKVTGEAISTVIAGSIAEISERHPLRMASFLERKLARAIDRDSLPEIENWKDANTADSMLRRSLGLDRQQTAVQVNLWSSPVQGQVKDSSGLPGIEEWTEAEIEPSQDSDTE